MEAHNREDAGQEAERMRRMEQEINRLRRSQKGLMICVALLAMTLLTAWRQPPAPAAPVEVLKAKRFEAVDEEGMVRVRIGQGRIALLNREGKEKALITADENNGNLTMAGKDRMRLSIFMTEASPAIVLYNPKGNPIASVPPPARK